MPKATIVSALKILGDRFLDSSDSLAALGLTDQGHRAPTNDIPFTDDQLEAAKGECILFPVIRLSYAELKHKWSLGGHGALSDFNGHWGEKKTSYGWKLMRIAPRPETAALKLGDAIPALQKLRESPVEFLDALLGLRLYQLLRPAAPLPDFDARTGTVMDWYDGKWVVNFKNWGGNLSVGLSDLTPRLPILTDCWGE